MIVDEVCGNGLGDLARGRLEDRFGVFVESVSANVILLPVSSPAQGFTRDGPRYDSPVYLELLRVMFVIRVRQGGLGCAWVVVKLGVESPEAIGGNSLICVASCKVDWAEFVE